MQSIADEFEDRTFRYTHFLRHGDVAIYTQTHKASGARRYEVVRIRVAPAHVWPDGSESPEREVYPPSSAWGRLGWTFHTEGEAFTHYRSLWADAGDTP